ncbi:hypothetical protein ACFFX0_29280 [Citricoccus parietis]|uniref:Uncharacterized protein n=1 Tax=Citricoccus parietis TaxID=592307 RepID=A0ABV5G1D1_9MICC
MAHGARGHDARPQGADPVLQPPVRGGHHHSASGVGGEQTPDDGHHLVVALARGVEHLDPLHRLKAAGLALGDQDDPGTDPRCPGAGVGRLEAVPGQDGEVVPEPGGGAQPVSPPAVRDGADHVGGVHDERQ